MSNAPKSTPGPWRVGNIVKHMLGPDGMQIVSRDEAVAMAYRYPDDIQEGNARLIAAAPELAEALRELHDFAVSDPHYRHGDRSVRAFENAGKLLERVGY